MTNGESYGFVCKYMIPHARTHARTHALRHALSYSARTHARTHACMHAHTHARMELFRTQARTHEFRTHARVEYSEVYITIQIPVHFPRISFCNYGSQSANVFSRIKCY